MRVYNNFKKIIFEDSKILILGTFPSIKSREENFYYANKRNRFWPMMSSIFNIDVSSMTKEEKIVFLKEKNIALYDVVESCVIDKSKDSSIKDVEPANIKNLIANTKIKKILLNGKKAYSLFEKCNKCNKDLLYMAKQMPSTSPANASVSLDEIINIWKKELI